MKIRLTSFFFAAVVSIMAAACAREPLLHLHRDCMVHMKINLTDVDLHTIWAYEPGYDYEREWVYGWDNEDKKIFGPMGYGDMNEFQVRRYYIGYSPYEAHKSVRKAFVNGNTFTGSFELGYHDILAWNDIKSIGYGQAIMIAENLDSVTAYTGETHLKSADYPGLSSSSTFNQPESLCSGYLKSLEINDDPSGYTWNSDLHCMEKNIEIALQPATYIYLVQFVLHNNNGRITLIQGDSNISAMAAGVCLNSGITFKDAVTVNYLTRFKKGVIIPQTGENVDVIGGKLTTFGLCGINPTKVETKTELDNDKTRHYLDLNVTFLNGMDSTMVFDVTDKIKERFKGGIITIELDVNDIKIPVRPGGSGFNAVVKDPYKEEYEIII